MKFTKFVKSLASEGVIYETNQILEKRNRFRFRSHGYPRYREKRNRFRHQGSPGIAADSLS